MGFDVGRDEAARPTDNTVRARLLLPMPTYSYRADRIVSMLVGREDSNAVVWPTRVPSRLAGAIGG